MEMRYAYQVEYSIRMIADIPGAYNRMLDARQELCARAMLDAFYVHIRLLADFLIRRTKNLDFGPSDFGVPWQAPNSAEAQRLSGHWDVASKYVSHFSRDRVPSDLDSLNAFPVGATFFVEMARDAIAVVGSFVRALESELPDSTCQSGPATLLRERAVLLRRAYDDACAKLGIV